LLTDLEPFVLLPRPVGLYLLAGAIAGRCRHVARARTALFIGSGLLFIVVAFLIFQHIANSIDDS
jgi:hypothetical protein